MERLSVAHHRLSVHRGWNHASSPAPTESSVGALRCDILRTLVYFDMFDHPLRLEEIFRFLPASGISAEHLNLVCLTMVLDRQIEEQDGYFSVAGRSAQLAHARKEKEQRARTMWLAAKFMTALIRQFPFVRGVFVSGELSKGVASRGSDIDFYIVTVPGRVWIVRTLCTLFKVVFLFGRKKFFCYNHITSEERLEIDDQNFYTAVETVTLRPIHNVRLYDKFRAANSWVYQYLPNFAPPAVRAQESVHPNSLAERVVAALIPTHLLDRAETYLIHQWRDIWTRRYPELSDEKRSKLFQCTPDRSTAYARDFLERILFQYERRLAQFGLVATK